MPPSTGACWRAWGAHLGDPLPVLSRARGERPLRGWTTDPALLWVILAAWLYWLGGRGMQARSHPQPAAGARPTFVTGLATILLALASPIDKWADKLLWAHMLQHVLLLLVAPPLLALARPWNRMWRGLPLGLRRAVAQEVTQGRWSAGLRRSARFLGDPLPSWLLFSVTLAFWHLPFAYDATLRSPLVHAAEHALFFGTGLLFWTRVIDSPPWRSPLAEGARAATSGLRWSSAGCSRSCSRFANRRSTLPMRRRRADPAGYRPRRPAARRWGDVGARLDTVHDRDPLRRLPVARAGAGARPGSPAGAFAGNP